MALEYGPFNGLENAWDAYDFAEYFKLFYGNGVFPNPSNNLQVVTNANMQTKVSVGVGFVEGHKIKNTSDFILQHDIADGVLKRIDRVVMRANFLQNKGEIIIKKGTSASSPVAPNLVRNTDYYELALADVLINNGATVITQANITDQRLNTALCGIVATNITQLDTTTLALQYQAAFEQMTVEQQQEFEEWVDSLKDILDENVAATLATRLTDTETRLTQHLAQKGQPNGYASLDANGKVPSAQLNISIVDASTTQKGIVQLNNATNSTSTTQAATANAVKLAYDRANAAFQSASDGKALVASAITGKGITTASDATFQQIADNISLINTGSRIATGTATGTTTKDFIYADSSTVFNSNCIIVSGIGFLPRIILINNDTRNNQFSGQFNSSKTTNPETYQFTTFVRGVSNGTVASAGINYVSRNGYVRQGSFELPVSGSGSFNWIAIE